MSIPCVFFVRGAKSVPAVTAALVVMLDAVLNPLWPWLFIGEKLGGPAIIGGAIVIGAVIISVIGGRWSAQARIRASNDKIIR